MFFFLFFLLSHTSNCSLAVTDIKSFSAPDTKGVTEEPRSTSRELINQKGMKHCNCTPHSMSQQCLPLLMIYVCFSFTWIIATERPFCALVIKRIHAGAHTESHAPFMCCMMGSIMKPVTMLARDSLTASVTLHSSHSLIYLSFLFSPLSFSTLLSGTMIITSWSDVLVGSSPLSDPFSWLLPCSLSHNQ